MKKRNSTPAPSGYLTQEEVVTQLSPWLTGSMHVTQERMAGRLGREFEGWYKVGRRYFYKTEAVSELLARFTSTNPTKRLAPKRYEKTAA